MRIARVHIQNFRSMLNQVIDLDRLTVVVGPNGAGKSAVLRALDAFYDSRFTASEDDYYNRKSDNHIRIAVTYVDLTDEEQREYGRHVQADSSLTVTRILTPTSSKYHGASSQHRAFKSIRDIQNKNEKKAAYNELRARDGYNSLPTVRAAEDIEGHFQAWEAAHAEQCEVMEDDGQFFGFQNVGRGKLERFTRFLLVPAVREADRDATDGKGSAINQLLDLVIRNSLAISPDFQTFKTETQQRYTELVSPENIPQLQTLAGELSTQLHNFVPTANVHLEWLAAGELDLPMPKAGVQLEEDGFKAPVGRVGHGLQRAFVLSLLQRLAAGMAQPAPAEDPQEEQQPAPRLPNLILAIEEPELYQHPNRQRQLARVLRQLSEGTVPGVADRTQVLYCTHSPLFVELGSFNRVRRLSKSAHPDWNPEDAEMRKLPRITSTKAATLQAVADELYAAQDPRPAHAFTGESVQARMTALMTPWMNEGFFAEVVVLVEGEDDRAAILGAASHLNRDFEALGVAVIPCIGKNNLDRPLLAFRNLNIVTYTVFDGDANCRADARQGAIRQNKVLQRLLVVANPVDFPADTVADTFAVLHDKLETTLETEATLEVFTRVLAEFTAEFGFANRDQAMKSPAFVSRVLAAMPPQSVANGTLKKIVDRIWALAQNRHAQLTAPQGAANGT